MFTTSPLSISFSLPLYPLLIHTHIHVWLIFFSTLSLSILFNIYNSNKTHKCFINHSSLSPSSSGGRNAQETVAKKKSLFTTILSSDDLVDELAVVKNTLLILKIFMRLTNMVLPSQPNDSNMLIIIIQLHKQLIVLWYMSLIICKSKNTLNCACRNRSLSLLREE